jgi:large conductance mechanosensitive channel
MLSGFKTFIMRGNVVDLAVGVAIGAAFSNIVNSLVTDIITPIAAAVFGQPDFSTMAVTINGSSIMYGKFLNSALTFLIIALTIYFFVVLPINKLMIRAGRKGNIGMPPIEDEI